MTTSRVITEFGQWYSPYNGLTYRLVELTEDTSGLPFALEWGELDAKGGYHLIDARRYDESAMAEREGLAGLWEWALTNMPQDARHMLDAEATESLLYAVRFLMAAKSQEPYFLGISSILKDLLSVVTDHGVRLPEELETPELELT